MPASTEPEIGGRRSPFTISVDVSSAAFARFIALRLADIKTLRGTLRLTYITVRVAVFVPGSARQWR